MKHVQNKTPHHIFSIAMLQYMRKANKSTHSNKENSPPNLAYLTQYCNTKNICRVVLKGEKQLEQSINSTRVQPLQARQQNRSTSRNATIRSQSQNTSFRARPVPSFTPFVVYKSTAKLTRFKEFECAKRTNRKDCLKRQFEEKRLRSHHIASAVSSFTHSILHS
jgi:hypothetical protein